MNDKKDIQILLDESLAFLLERGFKRGAFNTFHQNFGNWRLTFESENCAFEIYCDRGEVDAVFLFSSNIKDKGFSLAAAIYMLTDGRIFFGSYFGDLDDKKSQIERIAETLKQYIDEILIAMPFWRTRFDLIENAISAVFDLTVEEYNRKQSKTT